MKYLINIVIVLVLILILLVINTLQGNSSKMSEKIKRLIKNAAYTIPMLFLNTGILFVIFDFTLNIFNIEIYFLDILLIASYGILIVSIGDYVSRAVLKKITVNNFSKKYGGINLTKEEMQEIYIRSKRSFFFWKYILNFLISGIVYSIFTDIVVKESNLIIVGVMSLSSIILYEFLLRKFIYK